MNRFVAIEFLPDRIDVVLMRGAEAVAARRVRVELPGELGKWTKALREASDELAQVVNELGASKHRAIVLYRSPTQAVDLASLDIKSAEQAEEAASLDALGGLSFNMEHAAVACSTVGRDLAGEARKTHVIVAADHVSVLTAIVELVTRVGLKPEVITPIDAAITAMMTQHALRRAAPLQALLYVGEQSSFFMIAGDGRLHFGRGLSLGVETLARTLTRPIRVRDQEQPVELDLDTAAAIIYRVGVPRGEQIVYEPLGLTGTQLRPLVQPVLQRYIVELRQSMRFALPNEDIKGMPLTLVGPGSGLAGFADLLEEELTVHPQRGASDVVYDRAVPGCAGSELHDAVQDRKSLKALALLPPALASKRRASEMRRWLWAGTAAALAYVAFDGVGLSKKVDQARHQADSLASQAAQDDALKSTRMKLTNAMNALATLENEITTELSACVSFRAILQELSRLTPESVRLVNVTFATRDGRTVGSLRGYAIKQALAAGDATAMGDTELKSFIERLQASPLVASVTLQNVERGALGSQPAENFQASVDFVSILPSLESAQIVSAPEDESP